MESLSVDECQMSATLRTAVIDPRAALTTTKSWGAGTHQNVSWLHLDVNVELCHSYVPHLCGIVVFRSDLIYFGRTVCKRKFLFEGAY